MTLEEQWYQYGRDSRLEGKPLHSNPYERQSVAWVCWATGWIDTAAGDPMVRSVNTIDGADTNPCKEIPIPIPIKLPYVVGVKFRRETYGNGCHYSPDVYAYKTKIPLQIGDHAVVRVPNGALKVVQVVEIRKTDRRASKWIIDKVDLEQEQRREHRKKRLAEIRSEVGKLRAKASEYLVDEFLAKNETYTSLQEERNALEKEDAED